MGNPAYVAVNLAAATTSSLSASTEDTVYTTANLVDGIQALPFRFTVTTGGNIDIDLGAGGVSYDTIAILGHNHDSTATYNFLTGTSSPAATSRATPAWRANGIWANIGAQTDRYVRISITDAGSDITEVGQVFVGLRTELTQSEWFLGGRRGEDVTDVTHETFGGVIWNYRLFKREVLEYRFVFKETSLGTYRTLHDAVDGQSIPFAWIPDVALTDVYYVRKEPNFAPLETQDKSNPPRYEYKMTVREESRGLNIAV